MSLFAHKKIGLPVEMAIVLKEDFSATESRTVTMVLMKMLVILTLIPTVPPHVTRAFVNYPTASVLKMDLKFPEIFAPRMIDVTEFLRWSL